MTIPTAVARRTVSTATISRTSPVSKQKIMLSRGNVRYTFRKEQYPGRDIDLQTGYRYTGQWLEEGLAARPENDLDRGLYFYGARWYDPTLGRFVQPDTIVPEPGNPQSLNRYSYGANNPLRYTDPSGHAVCASEDCNLVWHPVTENVIVRNVGSSALYRLILRVAKGNDAAARRLEQILDETGGLLPAQFGGLGGMRGDAGFAAEFRDDHLYGEVWGIEQPASRQLGHFLTAVRMGYEQSEILRLAYLYAIVGHEQRSDRKGRVGQFVGLAHQAITPSSTDIFAFRIAVEQDISGASAARDATLYTIYDPTKHGDPANRIGNSMEDLRLSVRGWRLGTAVAQGKLATNRDVANWLALYVAGGG